MCEYLWHSIEMQPIVSLKRLTEAEISFHTSKKPSRRSKRARKEKNYKDEQHVDFSFFEQYRQSRSSYLSKKDKQKKKRSASKVKKTKTEESNPFTPNSVILNTNKTANKYTVETKKDNGPLKKKFRRIIESDSDCSVENYGIFYAADEGSSYYEGSLSRDSTSLPQNSMPKSTFFSTNVQSSIPTQFSSPNISPSSSDVMDDDIFLVLTGSPNLYDEVLSIPKRDKSSSNFNSEKLHDYFRDESSSEKLLSAQLDAKTCKTSESQPFESSDLMQKSCDLVTRIMQDMDNSFKCFKSTPSRKLSAETNLSPAPVSVPGSEEKRKEKEIDVKQSSELSDDSTNESAVYSVLASLLDRVCLSLNHECNSNNTQAKGNRSCLKCRCIISVNACGLQFCSSCRSPSPTKSSGHKSMQKKAQEIVKKVKSPKKIQHPLKALTKSPLFKKKNSGFRNQILKRLSGSERAMLLFQQEKSNINFKKGNVTNKPVVIKLPSQKNKVPENACSTPAVMKEQCEKKAAVNSKKKHRSTKQITLPEMKSKLIKKVDKPSKNTSHEKPKESATVKSAKPERSPVTSMLSEGEVATLLNKDKPSPKPENKSSSNNELLKKAPSTCNKEPSEQTDSQVPIAETSRLEYQVALNSENMLVVSYEKEIGGPDYGLKEVSVKSNNTCTILPIPETPEQPNREKDVTTRMSFSNQLTITPLPSGNVTAPSIQTAPKEADPVPENSTNASTPRTQVPGERANHQKRQLPQMQTSILLHASQQLDAVSILSILDLDGNDAYVKNKLQTMLSNELEDIRSLKQLAFETSDESIKSTTEAKILSKRNKVTVITFAKMLMRKFGNVPDALKSFYEPNSTHDLTATAKSEYMVSDCMLSKAAATNPVPLGVAEFIEVGQIETARISPPRSETDSVRSDVKSEARKERSSCMLSSLLAKPTTEIVQSYTQGNLQQLPSQPLLNISPSMTVSVIPTNALVPVSNTSPVYVNKPLQRVIPNTQVPYHTIMNQQNAAAMMTAFASGVQRSIQVRPALNVNQRTLASSVDLQRSPNFRLQGPNELTNNQFTYPMATTAVPSSYSSGNIIATPTTAMQYSSLTPVGAIQCPNKTVPFVSSSPVTSLENMSRSLVPFTGAVVTTNSVNNTVPANPLRVQQVVLSNIQPAVMQNQFRMPPPSYNYPGAQLPTSSAQMPSQMPNPYSGYPPRASVQPALLQSVPNSMAHRMILPNQNSGVTLVPQPNNNNVSLGTLAMSGCVLCGKPATMRCKQCAKVVYCNTNCAKIYWHQQHRVECTPDR